MEKAVSCEHKYAMHFTELDELYEQAGTPLEKRLTLLQQNEQVVARRDDAVNREIALQIDTGQVDDAIQTMTTRAFPVAEGENLNVVDHWSEAHLLRAQKEIQAQHYADALSNLQAASTVPANLPIGIGFDVANPYSTELDYWRGVAYAGSGDTEQARQSWQHAAATPDATLGRHTNRPGNIAARSDQVYYKGLSLQKLGENEKARELFRGLVQSGQSALQHPAPTAGGSTRGQDPQRILDANAHYIAGLGYLGLQNQAAAKIELREAAKLSPDLLGARTALANLQ
jgi:tetratricopeptide (TPR) repeat protein